MCSKVSDMEKEITTIVQNLPAVKKDLFLRAFEFAKTAHQDQKRKSGDPYIIHPIAVAKDLWEEYMMLLRIPKRYRQKTFTTCLEKMSVFWLIQRIKKVLIFITKM
jgi:hypothetical protein